MTVVTRAHRILRRLGNYRSSGQESVTALDPIADTLIGIYENTPGSTEDAIIVGNEGIHLHLAGRWEVIPYASIREVVGPVEGDPRDASGVKLTLRDGRSVMVPVQGGNDHVRDAWEVMRFLMRVVSDLASQDNRDPSR